MTSMTSLWNGEKAVVLLFVSRVVFSLPFSLLSHDLALCFLALAAFYVEIRLENFPPISQFKTRPGASSGMLLGAVTLPSVLISKLIQMSRALSFDEVRLEEIDYIKMQYWVAWCSCFSVLIFFHLFLWHSWPRPWSLSIWRVKFAPTCISLCPTFFLSHLLPYVIMVNAAFWLHLPIFFQLPYPPLLFSTCGPLCLYNH